jgi:hypothetical protein
MKSIKQQYIDLTEGKMSQTNFMRNLRMTMPQYVTNVTSFKDAVRILKNKGILTEMRLGKWAMDDITPEELAAMDQVIINQWMKSFNSELENRDLSFEEEDKALEAIEKLGPEKLKKMYGMLQTRYAVNAFLGDVDEILSSDETLSEAKKIKLTADQVNNDELRMGIRVEMEHTDDPKKAEKIALDHLAENPFYYTQLKLSGVDTKALPSKEYKAIAKKKDETEMVDKANQMKTPKGVEKIKASANKAKKETNKPEKGIKMMSLVSKTARGVKKMDATGEKMKKIKENLESMYDAAEELAIQMGDYDSAVVALQDEMGLDSRTADQIASKIYPEDTLLESKEYLNPYKAAQLIASEYGDQLLKLPKGRAREDAALNFVAEKIKSTEGNTVATNIINGFSDEDWPMEFISELSKILRASIPQRVFDRNANITRGLNRIAGIEENKIREAIRKMIKQEIKY